MRTSSEIGESLERRCDVRGRKVGRALMLSAGVAPGVNSLPQDNRIKGAKNIRKLVV